MQLITINMIPSGTFPICYISQGDCSREIGLVLMEDENPYSLTGDETLTLKVRRPDGIVIETSVESQEGFWITITTSEEMSQVSGRCLCNLNITENDVSIGSSNFIMEVEGL